MEQRITRETYIRKLPYSVHHELCMRLDPGDFWKRLACVLCMPPDYKKTRYRASDITAFDLVKVRGSCTEALLLDWGTMNCSVGALVDALIKARLYFAADYLCGKDVLGIGRAPRLPGDEDTASTELLYSEGIEATAKSGVPTEGVDPEPDADLNDEAAEQIPAVERLSIHVSEEVRYSIFPYKEVQEITNNFNGTSRKKGGNLIGSGGFGTVFYGLLLPENEELAVKRLDDTETVSKQFKTEIETMLRFRHPNILVIKGFSRDGPHYCILYEYMTQGSLEDRLACKDETPPLSIMQRVEIAKGTARGITYLHTRFAKPLVHRDIKSANVLLDENLQAKIGDFGFAHIGGHGNKTSTAILTQNVIGTRAYMALEAVQACDVSIKLDTYSYGVILLELLTGMPPYDPRRKNESITLTEYVLDNEDDSITIHNLVDQTAGPWNPELVESIFEMAEKCLTHRKKKRPIMASILPSIEKWLLPD